VSRSGVRRHRERLIRIVTCDWPVQNERYTYCCLSLIFCLVFLFSVCCLIAYKLSHYPTNNNNNNNNNNNGCVSLLFLTSRCCQLAFIICLSTRLQLVAAAVYVSAYKSCSIFYDPYKLSRSLAPSINSSRERSSSSSHFYSCFCSLRSNC